MFRNILSVVPFVLCNLMAADAGGGEGGGGNPEPTPPEPTPPTPPTPPEPEGNTLEDKLTNAKGIIGKIFKQLGTAISDLTKAQGDNKTLESQFNALKKTADDEKTAHDNTKGLLQKANDSVISLTGDLDKAKTNVGRLESLCQLRGIDPSQAVPPVPVAQTGDEERAELVSRLEKEKDPAARNAIANKLRKFDAKRKAEKEKAA